MQPDQDVKYKEIDHEQATVLVEAGVPVQYYTCSTRDNYFWSWWPNYRHITPSAHHSFCRDASPRYPAPRFRVEAE